MARIKKAQTGDDTVKLRTAKKISNDELARIRKWESLKKSRIKESLKAQADNRELKKLPKLRSGGKTSIKKAQTGNTTPEANKPEANKKVRLKEDSRAYITKIKTDDKGNIVSLKSRRTLKGLLTGAPRAKKIMKSGGKVVKKSTSKSKKK